MSESQESQPAPRGKTLVRALKIGAAAVLLLALAGGSYWALTCPCDTAPGVVLLGDVHEAPVTDWGFANDVDLCQIQLVAGWRPLALNLNCMATPEGDLFLSCSFGENKYWCPRVEEDHRARLRLDGTVYPVILNRVTDPSTMAEAWEARIQKLQQPEVQARQPGGGGTPPPLDQERPGHWWTFRVESRAE